MDTIKRRMQVNSTKGYSRINYKSEIGLAKHMLTKEGPKSFYKGFSLALLRNVPMAFLQFLCYQNLGFISNSSESVSIRAR